MGTIVTAMVQGALVGGSVAAVTGGDVGKGLLLGAAGGGLGGAMGGTAAGSTSGAAAGSQAGMLASQTAGFTAAELAGWGGATSAGTAFFGGTSAAMEARQMAGLSAGDIAGWGGATAVDAATATAGAGAAAGGVWDTLKQAGSFVNDNKGLINIGTGIYGMTQAQALAEQARLAGAQTSQWTSSGGQALGVQQLQSLMLDPSQQAATDPAYKLRMQAAQRAMAGYGQNSGMMAIGGANASTDWYNQRMAQLAGVAGAPGNPVGSAQVAMTGAVGANTLMNQSLQGVGYGIDQWFGGRK